MAKTVFSGNMKILNAWLNKVFSHRHDGQDQDGSAPLDYAADTGAADAYVITLDPPLTAYVVGLPMWFKAANANTGGSTCNVNGLGAKTIKKGGSALTAEDILANQIYCLVYDGTYLQLHGATNAKKLQGYVPGNSSGNIPVSNGTLNTNLNAEKLQGYVPGNSSGNIPVSNGTLNTNLNAEKLQGYTPGNSSGKIPVNNGTVNTNLNADYLDGKHRVVVASGNVSIAVGGFQQIPLSSNTGQAHHYEFSCWCAQRAVYGSYVASEPYARVIWVQTSYDVLEIVNGSSLSRTVYYEVYEWQ